MTQEGSRFDLGVIDTLTWRVDAAVDLPQDGWQPMQELSFASFDQEIRRHPHDPNEQIPENAAEYLIAQSAPLFGQRRIDPSLAPGNEGQRFENPQVVRAFDETDNLVAYSHSVINTSPPFARIKMAVPLSVPYFGGRKYARISELSVDPDLQGKGIGTLVAYRTLSLYPPEQPVSAYVYDREFPLMSHALNKHGMTHTDSGSQDPYRENGGKALLLRYEALNSLLMRRIEELPGAGAAILRMNQRTVT